VEYPVNHLSARVLISVIKCDLKYAQNGIFGIDNNYRDGAYERVLVYIHTYIIYVFLME